MVGSTSVTSSSRSAVLGSGAAPPSTRIRVRSPSTSCWVGATPTSAASSASSIDSQVSSSSWSRLSSDEQPLAEAALRAGQPLAQPDHPRRGRLRPLDRGGRRGARPARSGLDDGRRWWVLGRQRLPSLRRPDTSSDQDRRATDQRPARRAIAPRLEDQERTAVSMRLIQSATRQSEQRTSAATAARISSGIGVTGRAGSVLSTYTWTNRALGGRLVAVLALEQPDPVDDRGGAELLDDDTEVDRRRVADLGEVPAGDLGHHADRRQRADVGAGAPARGGC